MTITASIFVARPIVHHLHVWGQFSILVSFLLFLFYWNCLENCKQQYIVVNYHAWSVVGRKWVRTYVRLYVFALFKRSSNRTTLVAFVLGQDKSFHFAHYTPTSEPTNKSGRINCDWQLRLFGAIWWNQFAPSNGGVNNIWPQLMNGWQSPDLGALQESM